MAFCVFTFASHVNAGVITFEGSFNTIYSSPIARLGFDIGNPIGQEQHFHEITSTNFGLPSNGTGILLNDRDTEIFVAANGASSFTQFSLVSVDVAAALGNNPANDLRITGFLNNVVTGTILVSPLGSGYTSVAGSGLGTVDRLIFDGLGGGGGFALDNLNLNEGSISAVPEPGNLMIWSILASAGVAFIKRQRKLA